MRIVYLLVALTLLLAACGPEQTAGSTTTMTPQVTPLPTATPTAVPPSLTPTPAATPTPEATPTPRPLTFAAPNFVFQGSDSTIPIISRNPSAALDNLYINPGAVIFHDNQFHMLFNSFTAWPGIIQIGYAISDDGYQWEMAQEEPVFTSDQVPFGNGFADVSSAVVLDDGTWVIYFHTISSGQIGLATARSPLGPWTVEPEPILERGPEDAWDERGLFWPNVLRVEDTYYMYYSGKTGSRNAIGLAHSSDGLNWTKYDDPETTEPAFQESDPVLVSGAEWESNSVDRPRVQHTPEGWVMIFAGSAVETRGLALSNDGLSWETHPDNPILTPEDFPRPNAKTWDTALLYHQGEYLYFMEIGTLAGTDLYLTVHAAPLRE